jgi:hypothetical protein
VPLGAGKPVIELTVTLSVPFDAVIVNCTWFTIPFWSRCKLVGSYVYVVVMLIP